MAGRFLRPASRVPQIAGPGNHGQTGPCRPDARASCRHAHHRMSQTTRGWMGSSRWPFNQIEPGTSRATGSFATIVPRTVLRCHRPREGQRGIDLRINIATSYTTKSTGPGLGWRNNVHRCAKTYSARIAATAQRLRWCEFPAEAAMRVSRGYGDGGQRADRTGFSMWLWVSGRGGWRPPPADRPGSRNRQD